MNYEILVASTNEEKIKEIREILSPHKIVVYGLKDLNIKEKDVIENGKSYFENALIKANAYKDIASLPILSDDTGFEVLSLNNMPGLLTARFAKEEGGYQKAFEKINEMLKDKPRDARFVCDIVLINQEDKPLLFEGIVNGFVNEKKEGDFGFGYDPYFKVGNKTYASLSKEEKNKISHRYKALKKLITYLQINDLCK